MRRRRSSGLSDSASSPPIVIRPEVGSISRLIMRIVVVLPQPDGPTKIVVSPGLIVIVNSSTAGSRWPG